MARSWNAFRRDEQAAFTGWTAFQLLFLLLIPAALFYFWWSYLRRIGADEAARDPLFNQKARPVQQVVEPGPRVCRRCGLSVRPPKGQFPPQCPNCMSTL